MQNNRVTIKRDSLLLETTCFGIEAIRTMFTSALTTIAALQMIDLSKDDVALRRYIIIDPFYLLVFFVLDCHCGANINAFNPQHISFINLEAK